MFPAITSFCARVLGWGSLPATDQDCRLLVRPLANDESPAPARLSGNSEPLSANLLRASKNALDLITDRAFEPGVRLELEFPGPANFGPRMLACVVRSNRREDGKWTVECWLPLSLGASDMWWLGVRRGVPAKEDRRRWPRWPYQKTAFFRLAGSEEAKHYPATVDDVSFGGARLIVSAPAPKWVLRLNSFCSGPRLPLPCACSAWCAT